MQSNKNKQIGYSDMRMHGFIMLAMIITIVFTPLLGMLASICMVIFFGLFAAIKIAQFQSHNLLSKIKFQR